MKRSRLLLALLVILLGTLIGCLSENISSTVQSPTKAIQGTDSMNVVITAPAILKTETPSPETVKPVLTMLAPTPNISLATTAVPYVICSPLSRDSTPALWDILSGTFDVGSAEREDMHPGVDFFYPRLGDRPSIEGEEIQAILPGVVSAAVHNRLPYGNMVIIETSQESLPTRLIKTLGIRDGESLYSLYAHMQEPPRYELGDTVTCGQVLGTVGKTGKDIAYAHLHLETRIGPPGSKFSAMAFYDTGATLEEMSNYVLWRTSGNFIPVDPMLIFSEYLSEENQSVTIPSQ